MLLLILFALLTIGFVVASLFTSLTEKNVDIRAYEIPQAGSKEFKRLAESITGGLALPIESEIEIFNNGNTFLNDLLREIEAAQNSVTITNYIFKEGVMASKIMDTLTEASARGVEVRLLLDAHGSSKVPEEKIETLKEAGGKVAVFRPKSFRNLTRIHRRSHVRAIVIDGQMGYVGGLAFDDTWLGDGKGEKEWRDLMFKFEGRLAQATQDQFNALWRQTDGEILTGEKFYPNLPPTADGQHYFVSLLHTPAPDVSANLLDLIWLTINAAKDHIYLATPYLTPPEEIVEALKAAVERGVQVEIVVPGPHTDTKIIQSATRSYYERLLEAGVKIYEYQPGRFHTKFLTVDGHWSLIGSANMDNRSATLNVENIFGLESQPFAAKLEKEFKNNKAQAEERTQENFQPNLFKQAYYRTVSLFVRQF